MKILFLLLLSLSSVAWAQSAARVVSVRGSATVQNRELKPGDVLNAGEQVNTAIDSSLRLLLNDRSLLDLGANTVFVIKNFQVQEKSRSVQLKLFTGRLWARVMQALSDLNKTEFEVETPTAVAGVRGTEFVVDVDVEGSTTVTVIEGKVEMTPLGVEAGELLGKLTRGTVTKGSSSVKVGEIQQEDIKNTTEDFKPKTETDTPKQTPENKTLEENKSPQNPPTLDLDPGAGRTRVRGKIEIKDK